MLLLLLITDRIALNFGLPQYAMHSSHHIAIQLNYGGKSRINSQQHTPMENEIENERNCFPHTVLGNRFGVREGEGTAYILVVNINRILTGQGAGREQGSF